MLGSSSLGALFVLCLGLAEVGRAGTTPRRNYRLEDPSEIAKLTTNAARFAHGLPPLPPKNLFNPTKVRARQSQPSSGPSLTGTIKVTNNKNGQVLGHLSKIYFDTDEGEDEDDEPDDDHRFITTNTARNFMTVSFTPSSSPFDIRITNPSNTQMPFLSFAGQQLNNDLDNMFLTRAKHTDSGSKPKEVGNAWDDEFSASSIWLYNPTTRNITVQWVNPDLSKRVTYLWFDNDENSITIVADPVKVQKENSNSFPISFTLD